MLLNNPTIIAYESYVARTILPGTLTAASFAVVFQGLRGGAFEFNGERD